MIIRHLIRKDTYFDSVTLMLVTNQVKKFEGVEAALVGMGTDFNMDSLRRLNLYQPAFDKLTPADLLLCIQATTAEIADKAIAEAERLLTAKKTAKASGSGEIVPATQAAAARQLAGANMVVISVPGAWAAREADLALDAGRHVMLFSDNVGIDEELALKTKAAGKKLLVMGPDCGTAIINGVPLAFANAVRKGTIGLVAASGTGLQEVTSLIHRLGFGISQAIGVGGRDLSEKIAGRMTITAAEALGEDPNTKVLVLISKPPAAATLPKLYESLKKIKKPIVIYFIGADPESITKAGFIPAAHLEDAAIKGCEKAGGKPIAALMTDEQAAAKVAGIEMAGSCLRALYSGGTLCDEAQRLLLPVVPEIFSNTPVSGAKMMADIWKSAGHVVIDLGDDDFTRGKAHPMIDPSVRQERILAEFADPTSGLLVLDVVLGYGSHADMAGELVQAIEKARAKSGRKLPVLATICGTDDDFQGYARQVAKLEGAGVVCFPSNVSLMKAVKVLMATAGKGR